MVIALINQVSTLDNLRESCKIVYNLAISETVNDFQLKSCGNEKIDQICLNLTQIKNTDTTFSLTNERVSYTEQGLGLRVVLKELCIPFAPTLSSALKVAMLRDMFWNCDTFSY